MDTRCFAHTRRKSRFCSARYGVARFEASQTLTLREFTPALEATITSWTFLSETAERCGDWDRHRHHVGLSPLPCQVPVGRGATGQPANYSQRIGGSAERPAEQHQHKVFHALEIVYFLAAAVR